MAAQSGPEGIPPPMAQNPGTFVVNVFPETPPREPLRPDTRSADLMAQYLRERFADDPATSGTRLAWEPSGWALPGVGVLPGGESKEVTRYRKTDEWWL